MELYALSARERPGVATFDEALAATLGKSLAWKRVGADLSWLDTEARASLAPNLKESKDPTALREDIAQVLQSPEVRRCLGSLRHGHIVLPQPGREHDVLTFAGLANKQFGLACSRVEPDKPLMTFDEEAHVRLLFDAKARCPRCNEPLTSNDLRVIYTLTEEGAAAMSEPHWVLHPVARTLQEAGARVEVLPLSRNGRAVSALAFCGGWTVAVQVFDRDVAQDDLLRFSETCLELTPDHIAIVTTGVVRREAKELLEDVLLTSPQAQAREIGYFENYTPQNGAPLAAWWNELADNRLIALLEAHAFQPFRALGLSPSVLARAAVARPAAPKPQAGPQAKGPGPATTVTVDVENKERAKGKGQEPAKPEVKR